MSFVVEDGTGLSNANSYLSIADADAYHTDHSDPSAWSNASESDKQKALRLATQYLDIQYNGRWQGRKVRSSQALAWPRYSVYDADGYAVDTDALPQVLLDACAELALRVVNGDTLLGDIDNPGTIKRERIKAGPIEDETEYVGGKSQVKSYPIINGLLSGLITGNNSVERG